MQAVTKIRKPKLPLDKKVSCLHFVAVFCFVFGSGKDLIC